MSLKSVTAHLFPLVDFFSPRQRQNVSADGSIDKGTAIEPGRDFTSMTNEPLSLLSMGLLHFYMTVASLKKDVIVVNAFVTCLRSSSAVILYGGWSGMGI